MLATLAATVTVLGGVALVLDGATRPPHGGPVMRTGTGPRPGATALPSSGPGTFSTGSAAAATAGEGHQHIWRYMVQVEDGIGQEADEVAAEVARILADPRGWTADGKAGFRQVTSGAYDFAVQVASPGTVKQVCDMAGIKVTHDVNCQAGKDVMVSLTRWMLGSPQFPGPIQDYRALIINHEVGHRLGHGHETCPGKGRPAPAMMQQIDGLKGCRANAWPYDGRGRYISGPQVP
ncbi:DUF3152 domain-containing protein [Streptomyces sp. MMS24-I31]|uniref:DUF3152 domain-containing protein n=1 Tax=Streptomyces sp. MMS24-I31 TaxID=3351563 RepID=UPI003896923B